MKLTDLEPQFLKITEPGKSYHYVDSIIECDGLDFLCPQCFRDNGGPVGTHHMHCWQPHVPLTESPGPGRWSFEGTGYTDITLKAGSSSIKIEGGCNAHFFIKNGQIEFA